MHCLLRKFISQSQRVQKFDSVDKISIYCGEVNSFRSFSKMQTEETYDLGEGEG